MTTLTKTKHIDALHFEHELWRNEAKFYSDELKIYQGRLEYIAGGNTKEEVRKQVEHFQNQFIIQARHLKDLNHEVKVHENFLSSFAAEYPIAIDHQLFADHKVMREKMDTFRKLYTELKKEYNEFSAIWM